MNKRRSALKFGMFFLILSTCILPHADAHFIWVYAEEGKVKVVFGEGLEPDQAQFLNGLSSMQAFGREGDSPKALRFEKQVDGDEGWFEIAANHNKSGYCSGGVQASLQVWSKWAAAR